VPGCEATDLEAYRLLIGGEWVDAVFCGRHAAEYRLDEARRDV
jgi:hypothetical protein